MKSFIAAALLSLAAGAAGAKNLYIPVAGKTPGANGTSFRTDVRIFNPSPAYSIDVTLHFLPHGIDGRNIPGTVVRIQPREMAVIDDVAEFLVPGGSPIVGAIRLDSDTDASYDFIADSRTWTPANAPHPGSYGQFVPALDPVDALIQSVVLHVSSVPQFRTNVGVMNPGSAEATVTISLYVAQGTYALHAAPLTIPPKSMRQVSLHDLFGGLYLPDGYLVFNSTLPVFTWGSVVDNFTGDGFVVPGRPEGAEPVPLGTR